MKHHPITIASLAMAVLLAASVVGVYALARYDVRSFSERMAELTGVPFESSLAFDRVSFNWNNLLVLDFTVHTPEMQQKDEATWGLYWRLRPWRSTGYFSTEDGCYTAF